tara:strand:+ start:1768 stop:2253 length:486 start_codon:yes stop_codon:yes gene_type:complete
VKKRLITIYLIFIFSITLSAEIAENKRPIEFKNIHWGMSIDQIKGEMRSQFNPCYELDGVYMCGGIFGVTLLTYQNIIVFTCFSFNGCSYSPSELRDLFGKRLELNEWEPRYMLGGEAGEYYCARGAAKDLICTGKHSQNNPADINVVYLMKGSLGAELDF